MNMPNPTGWRQRIFQALALLLIVALGARIAANLLAPIVPVLVVSTVIGSILWILFSRRHQ